MEINTDDIFEKTTKFNNGIKLYMFQTGSIKTKLKFIKMNHSEEPYEIPVPWFLIKHPEGDVIIDGLKHPQADGSAGQFLKTDGAAQLSFATVLQNVVEDTSPQLGGMLDVNGNALGDGTLELIKFSETASAVNEFTVKNAATGNAPELQATGDDTNIDIKLVPKGTGDVVVGAVSVKFTNWTITEDSGVLKFATGGTNKAKLDASGNLTVVGDVTAFGTI